MFPAGSVVSRGECRGRGEEDHGGMHCGAENGSGEHRGVDSIGGGQDGVALLEKMMQS